MLSFGRLLTTLYDTCSLLTVSIIAIRGKVMKASTCRNKCRGRWLKLVKCEQLLN